MSESSPDRTRIFKNMMDLALNLEPKDLDAILKTSESGLIPRIFRYLPRGNNDLMLAATRPAEFVSGVYGMIREAVIFGVPWTPPLDASKVFDFSQADIASYVDHRPRAISGALITALEQNVTDRLAMRAVSAFLNSAHAYLLVAKKERPADWTITRFSDFIEIQRPIPAQNDLRMELIRKLMLMRLARIPGALATMESAGAKICEMDELTLLSSLDASILAITEQYLLGIEHGIDSALVIQGLARIRAAPHSHSGQHLPPVTPPFTFEHYMKFYLLHAHSHGIAIEPTMIAVAVRAVCAFYGRYGAPLM